MGRYSFPDASRYGSADDAGNGSGDPADEKRGHVRLLPRYEVVAQDDNDLRVELHVLTLAVRRDARGAPPARD
jgi:hypothetical protein